MYKAGGKAKGNPVGPIPANVFINNRGVAITAIPLYPKSSKTLFITKIPLLQSECSVMNKIFWLSSNFPPTVDD